MGEKDINDPLSQRYCFSEEEQELIVKVLLDDKYDYGLLWYRIPKGTIIGSVDAQQELDEWEKTKDERYLKDMHEIWNKSKQVYQSQGCSAVIFKMYPGLSHSEAANDTGKTRDVIAFFKDNIK